LSVVSCGGSGDLVGLLFQALVAFVGCLILLLLASTLLLSDFLQSLTLGLFQRSLVIFLMFFGFVLLALLSCARSPGSWSGRSVTGVSVLGVLVLSVVSLS
jgi:hypothetical protein